MSIPSSPLGVTLLHVRSWFSYAISLVGLCSGRRARLPSHRAPGSTVLLSTPGRLHVWDVKDGGSRAVEPTKGCGQHSDTSSLSSPEPRRPFTPHTSSGKVPSVRLSTRAGPWWSSPTSQASLMSKFQLLIILVLDVLSFTSRLPAL